MRFSLRFFSGSGLVLGWFFQCFLFEECSKITTVRFSRNPWKYRFYLGKIDIFKVSKITKMQTNIKNASKKSMFFGTSFLEDPGDSKTLSGATRNVPKSSRERSRTWKKRPRHTTNAASCEKCAQEAPKTEKWGQHGPNMKDFGLPGIRRRPPLERKCSMLMQA